MNDKVIPIQADRQPSGAFEYISTKKDELVGWARKFSLFPYPFVTACCAMEFMAVSSTPYDIDRFGAEFAALLAAPVRPAVGRRHDQPQAGSRSS